MMIIKNLNLVLLLAFSLLALGAGQQETADPTDVLAETEPPIETELPAITTETVTPTTGEDTGGATSTQVPTVPSTTTETFILTDSPSSSTPAQAGEGCIVFDEIGQASTALNDCVCHPSCKTCGYYGKTVSGMQDCYTCTEGLLFTELFPDGSGTCTASDSSTTSGGICFMLYQLADNNLEPDIREDLSEITKSAFTQSTTTTTWVYHDALNESSEYYTGGPLADVFTSDGTPLTENFSGSRYLTWDHALGKMVVDSEFFFEENSDSPDVLYQFLDYGLTDCVAKGKSEFFLALSSHGTGYDGFGGDLEVRRHRKLLQSNANISSTIQEALSLIPGAPSQLDVLGFDACLMSSVGALEDFGTIAKYYLASEATEPGHGWAYNELSPTTSALALGSDIVNTFVSSKQGKLFHDTPKTLALIDTTAFIAFRDAWDAMSSEMADILDSGNDADFHAYLNRARSNTLAFSGYSDYEGLGKKYYSAMDIGDFFERFLSYCSPDQSSLLYTLMLSASETFAAMFVENKVGPGTAGSGMHITWVTKQEYNTYPDTYREWLHLDTDSPFIVTAPNYLRLLESFYSTTTPDGNAGVSVCGKSAGASRSPSAPTDLLIDPSLVFVDAVTTEIRSEITRNVDFVFVEYAVDVTNWLGDERVRRRLDESARKLQQGPEGPEAHRSFRRRAMKWRHMDDANRKRRLQQDAEDYYYLFGGDVFVEYEGSNITASWDSTFFWINPDDPEPVYVYDMGGGLKEIPVCYFDQNHPVTSERIDEAATVEDAITTLGCQEAYLSFSNDVDVGISLYSGVGGNLAEVPRGAGRSIVTILYFEYNYVLYELLGGLMSTQVIPWTSDSNITLFPLSDYENLAVFEADTAIMDITAYDFDSNITDFDSFAYGYDEDPTFPPTLDGGEDPTTTAAGTKMMSPNFGTCIAALISTCMFVWIVLY